ncbi:MAG: OadG family protein [Acetatifactor sp.]|nr:OadG family protein [Acetatifactor sp.]
MKKRSAVICAAACVLGLTACGSDLGDRMTTAAMNTVIGISTVFVVLVIIIGVISLFRFIPVLQDKFEKRKNRKKKNAVQESAASAVTQNVNTEEDTDISDDLELVAVIAAAIAASEGAATTDGFVVRSIRKVNRVRRA